MPRKLRIRFPGLAEVARFAATLRKGFVIDTNRCLLTALLSAAELERALNRFQGECLAN